MKVLTSLVLGTLVASGTLLIAEASAQACSAPICYGATASLLPQAGATIPANATGVSVFEGINRGEPSPAMSLTKTSGGATTAVAFTILDGGSQKKILSPDEGFEIGARYDVSVGSTCLSGGTTATSQFTVGAAAPKPTSLGTLRIGSTGVKALNVSSGGRCTEVISAAQAEIELGLSAGATPWAAMLRYETYVDGEFWAARADATMQLHPAGSWVGIGKDLVYSACGNPVGVAQGVSPGRHQVLLRAYLPGNDTTSLDSNTVEIDLSCGAPSVPPSLDAGTTTPGPITVGDAAVDDTTSYRPNDSVKSSGCSAAPGSTGPSGMAVLGFGLVALSIVARRRSGR